MKKLTYLFIILMGTSFSSCKKCASCTSTTLDSNGNDSTIVGDFCDKGNVYKNTLYQYERSGWICTEE